MFLSCTYISVSAHFPVAFLFFVELQEVLVYSNQSSWSVLKTADIF